MNMGTKGGRQRWWGDWGPIIAAGILLVLVVVVLVWVPNRPTTFCV